MQRRGFMGMLGGAAAAWPVAVRAQQAKLPTIGLLGLSTRANWLAWTAALVYRLGELGWLEGRTVAIEYRWADGRSERFSEIAAELVHREVDVIVTVGEGVLAAKGASSTIPIVFAMAVDPVSTGMVASLAKPGGNATGISIQSSDLVGKRIELLREVIPNLRHLAVLGNVGYAGSVLQIEAVRALGHREWIEVDVVAIRSAADIAPAFAALKSGAQALVVCPDGLVNANIARINAAAKVARLPAIHPFRDYLATGGLLSYGANNEHAFRQAAEFVAKILKGAKPGDLPVEQPTRFELVLSMTAAKMLGLKVPESLLVRADEVIE